MFKLQEIIQNKEQVLLKYEKREIKSEDAIKSEDGEEIEEEF